MSYRVVRANYEEGRRGTPSVDVRVWKDIQMGEEESASFINCLLCTVPCWEEVAMIEGFQLSHLSPYAFTLVMDEKRRRRERGRDPNERIDCDIFLVLLLLPFFDTALSDKVW